MTTRRHTSLPGSTATARRAAVLLSALVVAVASSGFSGSLSAAPTCFGRAPTDMGGPGDDTLIGTGGSDVIIGRGGHDTIRGRGGRDFICGMRGEDVIYGGRGGDKLGGGRQIDYIVGSEGDDKMLGGSDGDELHGEIDSLPSDRDVAKGVKGADFIDIQDGRGNDVARGGPGADTCDADVGDTTSSC